MQRHAVIVGVLAALMLPLTAVQMRRGRMQQYRVRVPFRAVVRENLTAWTFRRLPDTTVHVGDVTVSPTSEKHVYVAETVVNAEAMKSAIVEGTERVSRVLRVFSMDAGPYEIMPRYVKAKSIDGTGPGSYVGIHEGFGVGIRRTNLKFEQKALRLQDRWPEYLETALKLYHLAECSGDTATRFLLSMMTLEALTTPRIGNPPTIPDTQLSSKSRKDLKKDLSKLLETYGLSKKDQGRLMSQFFQTHVRGRADQFQRYFKKVGVTVDQKVVVGSWELRGRVAHGQPIDRAALDAVVQEIHKAVAKALQYEVTNPP